MIAYTLWRIPLCGIARRRDWFRSSIRVLFGDAVQAVIPLGGLILQDDDRALGPIIDFRINNATLSP